MTTYTGENGLKYTASSEESITQFEALVTSYLSFGRESGTLLKALLAHDPDMPMVHCMQGYFQKLFANAKMSGRAKDTYSKLQPLLESADLDDREKQHIAALGAWTEGDLQRTVDIWERILVKHPLDSLALRMAHYLHFYSGDGRRMRDSVLRVLPHWQPNHQHYGFVLGMGAFGYEESGDYSQAERLAREATDINQLDVWAVHALAHVFEMQERHQEGIAWVDSLEEYWEQANNFRFHVAWHRCLYQLEMGDMDSVLAVYDEQLVSDLESGFNLDLCNAASLLWRLTMFDVDVGDRWSRLAEVSKEHVNDRDLVFVTLHYFMSLLGGGDEAATRSMLECMGNWSKEDSTQGFVCSRSGTLLAQALRDVSEGDFSAAADVLSKARYLKDEIGGSQAQRDVFDMLQLFCTYKGGDYRLAEALFAERIVSRPHSIWSWLGYADALDKNGNDEAARGAREKAQALRAA